MAVKANIDLVSYHRKKGWNNSTTDSKSPSSVEEGTELIDELLKKILELENEVKSLKKEMEGLSKIEQLQKELDTAKKDTSIVIKLNILDSDERPHFIEVAKEEKYAFKEMNVSGAGVKELRNFVSEYDKLCMLL